MVVTSAQAICADTYPGVSSKETPQPTQASKIAEAARTSIV